MLHFDKIFADDFFQLINQQNLFLTEYYKQTKIFLRYFNMTKCVLHRYAEMSYTGCHKILQQKRGLK